jgi:hypothetical protein
MLVSVARLGPLAYRLEQILTEKRFPFHREGGPEIAWNSRFLTQSNASTA